MLDAWRTFDPRDIGKILRNQDAIMNGLQRLADAQVNCGDTGTDLHVSLNRWLSV